MAAPRRYTDAQRAAMFRLYEAGKMPAEIARLCEEGMAGTAPFPIPRRTCHAIVTEMAAEAERKLPTSVAEAESADAVDRFPARIAGIVGAEIKRLEGKQEKGPLSASDYDRLSRATDLSFALERRLRQRQRNRGKRAPEGTADGPEKKSEIEKLAERLARKEKAEAQVTSTRTNPDTGDDDAEPGDESPPEPVSHGDNGGGAAPPEAPPAEQAAQAAACHTNGEARDITPAERAQVARRARAVLAAQPN